MKFKIQKWGVCLAIIGNSIVFAQGQVVPNTEPPKPNKNTSQVAKRPGIHDGMKNELVPFIKRANYGRKLEIVNKVYHGAGQSNGAFKKYDSTLVPNRPSVYMQYVGLRELKDGNKLRNKLRQMVAVNPELIVQLGLAMTQDGKPEVHYEQDVAAGKYDAEIDTLINILKVHNRPVFLRLGYEFNGFWNGYQATTYKQAYRYVIQKIRKAGLNQVASMWCFAIDSDEDNFMDYYPGDDVVDWWSVDVFGTWHFDRPELFAFMDSAIARKYPVMIGESTPRRMSVTKGDSSWRLWFVPYFNLIRTYPNMKGISYINWNWTGTPWPDWGDGRIETAPADLKKRYLAELNQPWWLHSKKKK